MSEDYRLSLLDRLIDATSDAYRSDANSFVAASRLTRRTIERDLSWLLNTYSIDAYVDLSAYPEVKTSVLNYGMPALSGRIATSVDPVITARNIRNAIETFEPRMRRIRVTAIKNDEGETGSSLRFRIEAEYLAADDADPIVVDTRIALDSGDFQVLPPRLG